MSIYDTDYPSDTEIELASVSGEIGALWEELRADVTNLELQVDCAHAKLRTHESWIKRMIVFLWGRQN